MAETLLQKLLNFFKISTEEYSELIKEYTLDNFLDGEKLNNISSAKSLLKEVIRSNGKIIIYGDYDADGVMGVSILKKMFDYLHYDVNYYVPSRYLDGYGITLKQAKRIVSEGYNLVITVDNGISSFEPIEYLKNSGVKVLIIDHHTIEDKLPEADEIVHPTLLNLSLPTSGAFTALLFSRKILGYYDKYLCTLAAISLISDMMPLKGFNRRFLRIIFREYINGEFPSISMLAEHKQLDENIISSKIAPKINAIGRMVEDEKINNLISYFTSNKEDEIITYYNYINDINNERKQLSKDNNDLKIDTDKAAIVEYLDIKEGLIGLIANSLLTKYKKPTAIFTKDSMEGNLKGSVRSLPGLNVVEAFSKINNIIAYGGHELAGGCSIKEQDFDSFKKQFIQLAECADFKEVTVEPIEISLNNINRSDFFTYKSFSPFGEGWRSPIFKISKIKTSSLKFSKTKEHIMTFLGPNCKIVGFFISQEMVSKYDYIDVTGVLDSDVYNGVESYLFSIKEFSESKLN